MALRRFSSDRNKSLGFWGKSWGVATLGGRGLRGADLLGTSFLQAAP